MGVLSPLGGLFANQTVQKFGLLSTQQEQKLKPVSGPIPVSPETPTEPPSTSNPLLTQLSKKIEELFKRVNSLGAPINERGVEPPTNTKGSVLPESGRLGRRLKIGTLLSPPPSEQNPTAKVGGPITYGDKVPSLAFFSLNGARILHLKTITKIVQTVNKLVSNVMALSGGENGGLDLFKRRRGGLGSNPRTSRGTSPRGTRPPIPTAPPAPQAPGTPAPGTPAPQTPGTPAPQAPGVPADTTSPRTTGSSGSTTATSTTRAAPTTTGSNLLRGVSGRIGGPLLGGALSGLLEYNRSKSIRNAAIMGTTTTVGTLIGGGIGVLGGPIGVGAGAIGGGLLGDLAGRSIINNLENNAAPASQTTLSSPANPTIVEPAAPAPQNNLNNNLISTNNQQPINTPILPNNNASNRSMTGNSRMENLQQRALSSPYSSRFPSGSIVPSSGYMYKDVIEPGKISGSDGFLSY